MIGKYRGLIHENVAPKAVQNISIYDSKGVKRASMAVPGFLKYPGGTPLYSFGVVSDSHCDGERGAGLEGALGYFQERGCSFVCHCGDLTDSAAESGNEEAPFAAYKAILAQYSTLPVYAITGDADSRLKPISGDMARYTDLTGQTSLHYAVQEGGDLLLFAGQPDSGTLMTEEAFIWLQGMLAGNPGKRCFLFLHPWIPEDSGNPLQGFSGGAFADFLHREELLEALRQHGNVVVFHGHSHVPFQAQELDRNANYTRKNGFHSVHVPSIDRTAYDGAGNQAAQGAQCSYVEVFEDCIAITGVDLTEADGVRSPLLIPQGILKIDAARGPEERKLLFFWDFTRSLVDGIAGREAVLSGSAVRDSNGLFFAEGLDHADCGDEVIHRGNTLEMEFGDMSAEFTGINGIFFWVSDAYTTSGQNHGFGFNSKSNAGTGGTFGGFWSDSWMNTTIRNKNYFANSTLTLKFAEDGVVSVYRGDTKLPTKAQVNGSSGVYLAEDNYMVLGSRLPAYPAFHNMHIKTLRIYET